MSRLRRASALVLLLMAAAPAIAGERVVNGDFSEGTFAWKPWTVFGQGARTFTATGAPLGAKPPSFEIIAPGSFIGGIYQPLNLVPGEVYIVHARSRDLGSDPEASATILIGPEPPQDGKDYFDDGTTQEPPGTLQLLGWNGMRCPKWNGPETASCDLPRRLQFRATAPVTYLVVRCGPGALDVSFDDISIEGADPCSPPFIFAPPESRHACVGESATFHVGAEGLEPLSYQWLRNGKQLGESERFVGVTKPLLIVNRVDGSVVGDYACVVTSACGSAAVSEAASLTTRIVHVDAEAQGLNNGQSWRNAFTDLQKAILAAKDPTCEAAEVWVANGVYEPRSALAGDDLTSASFLLVDGVAVYGGFEGASRPNRFPGGETERNQRRPNDPDNATLLTNNEQFSRYVVTSIGNAPSALLDGFIITAAQGRPPGCVAPFLIRDTAASIQNNLIFAEGSQYIDLDPDPDAPQQPLLGGNRFTVRNHNYAADGNGTLLELRSPDYDCTQGECLPGVFQLDQSAGFSDPWAMDELEIRPGQRLTLTDRRGFRFQSSREVGYVETLTVRTGAVLNTAAQRLYCRKLVLEPGAKIINHPATGFSLDTIAMNDSEEFRCLLRPAPGTPVDAVRLVPDARAPGDGVMALRRTGTGIVGVKARFARSGEDFINVAFEYRFIGPPTTLVISLSDRPEPELNNIEVARVTAPRSGRPGAPDNEGFAVFQGRFPKRQLNLRRGTFVRLDLLDASGRPLALPSATESAVGGGGADGPGPGVDLDNWGAHIVCSYGCADLSGNGVPDDRDYLLLLSLYGQQAGGVTSRSGGCPDAVFGGDRYIDLLDLLTWDVILDPQSALPDVCPLVEGGLSGGAASAASPAAEEAAAAVGGGGGGGDHLVVAGKADATASQQDALYTLDLNGACTGTEAGEPAAGDGSRSNGRLVRDRHGNLYQIHGISYFGQPQEMQGLIRLTDAISVVPPRAGLPTPAGGPAGTVTVGINVAGLSFTGTPVSDAAFHPTRDDTLYITPVVVTPANGSCPYRAAAQLRLKPGEDPPYEVRALYGRNPAPESNVLSGDCESTVVPDIDTQQLRELAIDATETLYVTSAQAVGLNDYLLVYNGAASATGDFDPLVSVPLDGWVDGPIALAPSHLEDMLYLASSVNALSNVRTRVHRLRVQRTGGTVTGLTADGTVDINNPTDGDLGFGLVASISCMRELADGSLCVLGLTVPKIPADLSTDDLLYATLFGPIPTPLNPIFARATLAHVPGGSSGPVSASLLSCHDLALPLSVVAVDGTAPTLVSAVSRKAHGAAGAMDIPLPLSGPTGVECRAGGPTQIVLTFSEAIRADDGSPSSNEVTPSAGTLTSVSISGKTLTVNLSGVADRSCLTLTLAGLSDLVGHALAGSGPIRVRVLHGDASGDGLVASADITQVKSRSGQNATASNFRWDVNADGVIASADITQVKARSGNSAECP